MADKRIEFDLVFKSNITDAKKNMKELQKSLNDIATGKKLDLSQGMTQEIKEASKAASELQTHLLKATNVNTGRLNMNELERSIKASGGSLKQYAAQLAQLGPTGTAALMQVSQAIANAEKSTFRLSDAIDKMWVTMKNTMRWQLSTTALNAVTGAISGAYQYAQRLNRSLNDIRIVTGRSADEMATFAKQANKAAQALSTTTTAYTNASLIYYQQGLNDEEVAKRTETTIKLANVTRTSAETVSEWMTSIWNNFDNGSKSLEYYADVITALGAATASSSEEIATGLEKFSAVAESVGLSYEYATSALTTITATTRQSADVVGTALKTLFARIQDLELGKTLEDGTSLGQYSDNLAKIGVNVLDASGQLREMDAVLNDLGARWDKLTEAQKVATAQGVAGIRQYTQFMALMENWDFMQQNLTTAYGANGALSAQADIYAESWEAAQKRVTASAEQLYDSLLNDEVFIKMANTFADFLDMLDPVLKGLGSIPGILNLIVAGIIKIKGQDIANGLRKLGTNLFDVTTKGQEAAKLAQARELRAIQREVNDTAIGSEADANRRMTEIITSVSNRKTELSEQEWAALQNDIGFQQQLELQNQKQEEKVAALKEEKLVLAQTVEELEKKIRLEDESLELTRSMDANILSREKPKQFASQEEEETYNAAEKRQIRREQNAAASKELEDLKAQLKEKEKIYDAERLESDKRVEDAEDNAKRIAETYGKDAKNTKDWANTIVNACGAVTAAVSAVTAINSLVDTWKDPDTTYWEKMLVTFTSLAAIIPSIIMALSSLGIAINRETISKVGNAIANIFNTKTLKDNTEAAIENAEAHDGAGGKTKIHTIEKMKNSFSSLGKALGKIGPWALLIAAISAIAIGISQANKALNKFENDAKKAEERAASLAKGYNEVVEQTTALQNSWSSYKDGLNALQDLTKGTTEYREALAKANAQALELITAYEGLKYKRVDGAIVIDEESYNNVLENQIQRQEIIQATSMNAQVEAKNARGKAEAASYARNVNTGWAGRDTNGVAAGWGVGGGAAAAAAGTTMLLATGISQAWNPVGWALIVAGAVTAATTTIVAANDNASDRELKALDKLTQAAKEDETVLQDRETMKAALGDEYADIADSLIDNTDSLQDTIKAQVKLARETELLKDQIAHSSLNPEYKGGRYEEALAEYTEEFKDDNTKTIEKILTKGLTDGSMSTDNKGDSERMLARLFESYTGKEINMDHLEGTNWTIVGERTNDLSQKEALQTIASSMARELATDPEAVKERLEGARANMLNQDIEALMALYDKARVQAELIKVDQDVNELKRTGISIEDSEYIINTLRDPNNELDPTRWSREELEEIVANSRTISDNETKTQLKEALDNYDEAVRRNKLQDSATYSAASDLANEATELMEEIGIEEQELNDYADTLMRTFDLEEEVAKGVAQIYARANAGAEDLGKTLKTNLTTLQTSNKTTLAYSKALTTTAKSVSKLFDVDVNGEFIEENLDKLEKIASGDVTAFNDLRNAVAVDLLNQNKTLSTDQRNALITATQNFTGDGTMVGQTASANAAARELVNTLNEQIIAGTISAEEAADQLKAEGFAVSANSTYDRKLTEKEKEVFVADMPQDDIISLFNATQLTYAADTATIMEKIGEALEAQIDRYHYINEILEDQGRIIDNNKKLLERAWGNRTTGAWEAYEQSLKDEINYLEQKISGTGDFTGAEEWLRQDTDSLITQLKASGVSISDIKRDDQGRIVNIEDLERRYGKDENKESVLWKAFIQYEDSLNEWEQYNQELFDKKLELEDAYLEELKALLDEDLRVNEYMLKQLAFYEKALGDSKWSSLERISYAGDKFAQYADEFKDYEARIQELLDKDNRTKAEQEELIRLQGEAQNVYLEMVSTHENALKAFADEAAAWNEEIDKTENKLERLIKLADYYENVIDIVGTDRLGMSSAIREELAAARTNVAMNQVQANRSELEANQRLLDEARASRQEMIDAGADYSLIQHWDETIETLEKQVEESSDNFQESFASALQAAADEFAKAMDVVLDEFDQALGGIYGSIEQLTKSFERQQELSELYFADYKKVYEINKLNRKITDSIDTTTNVKAQQALRDLQSELLVFQESGVEMSKYDLEYKQKEYDLLVAQIALEEAQNAKNQVRLTRDASGNWGYVYTANAAETEKAQQEYEDKLYNLQEYANKSEEELVKGYLQTIANYKDQMAALSEEYDINSEEYRIRAQEIQEEFNSKIQFYLQESEDLIGNNALANSRYMTNLADTYQTSIWQTIYPAWKSFGEVGTNALSAINLATDTAIDKHEAMGKKFDEVCEAAGTDWSDLVEDITNAVGTETTQDSIAKAAKDASEAVGQMATNMKNALVGEGGSLSIFQNWANTSIEEINKVRQALGLGKWEIPDPTKKPGSTGETDNGGTGDNFKKGIEDTLTGENSGGGSTLSTPPNNPSSNSTFNQQGSLEKAFDPYQVASGEYRITGSHGVEERKESVSFGEKYFDPVIDDIYTKLSDINYSEEKTRKYTSTARTQMISQYQSWLENYSTQNPTSTLDEKDEEFVKAREDWYNNEFKDKFEAGNWVESQGLVGYSDVFTDLANWVPGSYSQFITGEPYLYATPELTKEVLEQEYGVKVDDLSRLRYFNDTGNNISNEKQLIEKLKAKKLLVNTKQTFTQKGKYWSEDGNEWRTGYKVNNKWYPGWMFKYLNDGELQVRDKYLSQFLQGKLQLTPWQQAMAKIITTNRDDQLVINTDKAYNYYKGSSEPRGLEDNGIDLFQKDGQLIRDKIGNISIPKTTDFSQKVNISQDIPPVLNATLQDKYFDAVVKKVILLPISTTEYIPLKFDTGGYTGEWGSSGKMAMLHEKEIVLNKYDTANLLSAIDLVRQFESSLSSMSWGLGTLRAISTNSLSNNLEQTVTIHAEFPNATDHNEIEQAFDNLVNLASQYAQKK